MNYNARLVLQKFSCPASKGSPLSLSDKLQIDLDSEQTEIKSHPWILIRLEDTKYAELPQVTWLQLFIFLSINIAYASHVRCFRTRILKRSLSLLFFVQKQK